MTKPLGPMTRRELRTELRKFRTEILTSSWTAEVALGERVHALEAWIGRPLSAPDAAWQALAAARRDELYAGVVAQDDLGDTDEEA